MNRWSAGRLSAASLIAVLGSLLRMWSGPAISGSSFFSGTNTVPPLLVVRSTPWSKNWPNSVNSWLYGGERPTSVVTFGMNSVSWSGTQSVAVGCALQARTPSLPWVRTGFSAAAIAAGLPEVWSTIRLLTVRGWESNTKPDFDW